MDTKDFLLMQILHEEKNITKTTCNTNTIRNHFKKT